MLDLQSIRSALPLFRRATSTFRRRRREGNERRRERGSRGGGGASACSISTSSLLDSFGSFCQVSPWHPLSPRAIFAAFRSLSPRSIPPERQKTHLPGIDALQRSALTSALPRAESSDARDDRGDESCDDASELPPAAPAAPPPPPNTLVFDSTLSSERRPSTRPSDVAGEGRAFSVVVASVFLVGMSGQGGFERVRKREKVVAGEDSVPFRFTFARPSTRPPSSRNPRPCAPKPAPTHPTRRCLRPCPWKSR